MWGSHADNSERQWPENIGIGLGGMSRGRANSTRKIAEPKSNIPMPKRANRRRRAFRLP